MLLAYVRNRQHKTQPNNKRFEIFLSVCSGCFASAVQNSSHAVQRYQNWKLMSNSCKDNKESHEFKCGGQIFGAKMTAIFHCRWELQRDLEKKRKKKLFEFFRKRKPIDFLYFLYFCLLKHNRKREYFLSKLNKFSGRKVFRVFCDKFHWTFILSGGW